MMYFVSRQINFFLHKFAASENLQILRDRAANRGIESSGLRVANPCVNTSSAGEYPQDMIEAKILCNTTKIEN